MVLGRRHRKGSDGLEGLAACKSRCSGSSMGWAYLVGLGVVAVTFVAAQSGSAFGSQYSAMVLSTVTFRSVRNSPQISEGIVMALGSIGRWNITVSSKIRARIEVRITIIFLQIREST